MSIELWEYLTATRTGSTWQIESESPNIPSDPGVGSLALLSAAGRDGWELVGSHHEDERLVHVFKRAGGPRQRAADIHEVGDA